MNIAVRLEGGLGDHLLSNRFVAAIKEKYQKSKIFLYSDTEGNPNSSNLLMKLFPSFYEKSEVMPYRNSKEFFIETRFGRENYTCHINNVIQEYMDKFKKADKFYDLHIDSLNWLNQDFDWLRYYYFFPKPQIELPKYNSFNDKYILCHFFARPNSPYNLEKDYAINLIKKLKEIINVVVITQKEHIDFYQDLFQEKNVSITTPNLEECFSLASECKAFIGIDSGIRYIPYHYSKPVFVFSKYCQQYGSVAPSHLIRWLIFQKNVFPINFDLNIVSKIMDNSINNPASQLFPEYLEQVDNAIVKRELL